MVFLFIGVKISLLLVRGEVIGNGLKLKSLDVFRWDPLRKELLGPINVLYRASEPNKTL